MEDSISSSSYSFSDHSMEDDINPVCTCKLTKVTYSQDQSFTHISEMKKAIISKHRQLDRSQSEPVLRLSDRDDNESAGLEPNCDLFGIQLEVTFHLLEAEKRKLYVLQRELGNLNSHLYDIQKHAQVQALEKSISHIQQQYDHLEEEYRCAVGGALRRKTKCKPTPRSQPAIGLKQTTKARPTIFGTIAEQTMKKEENNRMKNVVPQMQSLSQMFDKAGGGYDCHATNCNENDALMFKDGNLVAGSKEALIQHLVPTTEYNPDRTYVFTFLLSSRLFIRPHELLGEVCQVCTFQQNLTSDHIQKQKLGKFGQNVIQLLSEWTEMFPYDFRDERMMKQLKEISQRVLRVYPELRQDMGGITHNLLNKLAQLNRYEEVLSKLNAEAIKRSQTQIAPTTDIMEVCPSPLRLAEQLTHIELERLSQIGPEEFVQAFSKEETSKTVPVYRDMKKTHNLEAYVQWFNRLSYLVASEICSHLKKKNRVRLVEYFIDVAKECINIGNFNSLMAIIAGMNMNPVSRLKKTWAKVNKTKFGILELQMDPSNNFGSYRSCMKAAMWRAQGATDAREKIVIPFFSLFVKDIYFLNEGCPNRFENGNINFEKFWQMAKHISDFVTWQQVECPFAKHTDVLHYVLTSPVFSETTLSLASYECESPENSYDKERHKKLKAEAGL
ncbi:ras-GEF domain-containing family member 1B-like isoform X2 [Dreissena polymorpha]|uniref:ras-GEF domain-containing family member 1B-like isoform X2 n=1 Tax=Dreissena polymorpha TaxID=45954 RepID=UPI0022655823|nr:ras-GEF domain-containing family member 1B-like isoform X2 [Dreissena polymorpha]